MFTETYFLVSKKRFLGDVNTWNIFGLMQANAAIRVLSEVLFGIGAIPACLDHFFY